MTREQQTDAALHQPGNEWCECLACFDALLKEGERQMLTLEMLTACCGRALGHMIGMHPVISRKEWQAVEQRHHRPSVARSASREGRDA